MDMTRQEFYESLREHCKCIPSKIIHETIDAIDKFIADMAKANQDAITKLISDKFTEYCECKTNIWELEEQT